MVAELIDLDRIVAANNSQVAPCRASTRKDTWAAVEAGAERYLDRDTVVLRSKAVRRQELCIPLNEVFSARVNPAFQS